MADLFIIDNCYLFRDNFVYYMARHFVVGIAGSKNAGKDTVASMIDYICLVGVTSAKYITWLTRRISKRFVRSPRVFHFGDKVKDVLSVMYGIPREYFYDRKPKDTYCYCINDGRVYEGLPAGAIDGYMITNNHISEHGSLNKVIEAYPDKKLYIGIRTLMQYFATDVCRANLDDKIWIRTTIANAERSAYLFRLGVIADVRFDNEVEAIKRVRNGLYGGIIMIRRNGDGNNDSHVSEQGVTNYDYLIENDGELMNLFYKVLEVVKQIVK